LRILFILAINWLLLSSVEAKLNLAVSNATSGPASELGRDLNIGAELYFSQLKDLDVHLDKKDDGYEPGRTLVNTRDFVASGHDILCNYLGTPTTRAILNYTIAKQLSLITPYTGADFLRQKTATNVFNLRASYEQEAEFQAKYFIEQLQLVNIGIVIQADDFGLAFEKHFVRALKRHGLKPKFISRFKRNSNNVASAIAQVKKTKTEVLVFIGTYEPMAKLIKNVIRMKPNLIYSSVSFVSSDQLIKRIPESAKVLISEVVPNPMSCEFKECRLFRTLAEKKGVHINHGVFEGYLNAHWLTSALKNCQSQNRQPCISQVLQQEETELLGKKRQFNLDNRQLLNEVFATTQNLPQASF